VIHYQAAKPTGWELADEVTLPGGRHLTGTAARVYNLLAETARRGHRWKVGRHPAPAGGWVPTWVLREPWAGGSAGDRRLRDLREEGVPIEMLTFTGGDLSSRSNLWRITPNSGEKPPGSLSAQESSGLPLAGLTVRFLSVPVKERPPEALDVSPGAECALAPSIGIADDEAYRRELLATYRDGRLLPALAGLVVVVLWTDPAAAFDPRRMLGVALRKLGAQLGG